MSEQPLFHNNHPVPPIGVYGSHPLSPSVSAAGSHSGQSC